MSVIYSIVPCMILQNCRSSILMRYVQSQRLAGFKDNTFSCRYWYPRLTACHHHRNLSLLSCPWNMLSLVTVQVTHQLTAGCPWPRHFFITTRGSVGTEWSNISSEFVRCVQELLIHQFVYQNDTLIYSSKIIRKKEP